MFDGRSGTGLSLKISIIFCIFLFCFPLKIQNGCQNVTPSKLLATVFQTANYNKVPL
jgi:hypothetical protein